MAKAWMRELLTNGSMPIRLATWWQKLRNWSVSRKMIRGDSGDHPKISKNKNIVGIPEVGMIIIIMACGLPACFMSFCHQDDPHS